ncbi:MAG TPA: von Willebrand factor type A domain-containing protein, partial [Cyclobacteriaceae bacterium]|nr:von Willebrand factor type A domain-containing protein [Cyclobacteriaceae bacterium]
MKRINIAWLVLVFVSLAFSPSPERLIRGKVTAASDGSAMPGVSVILKGTSTRTVTDGKGEYQLTVPASGGTLVFTFVGYVTREVKVSSSDVINVQLEDDVQSLSEIVVTGKPMERTKKDVGSSVTTIRGNRSINPAPVYSYEQQPQWNTEEYDGINENIFHEALRNPLSTFSIDVDAASYSNVRRFINNGQRPPKDAVRIEEMVNYFDYDYDQPPGEHPFEVITEISTAPWNEKHKLVHVGLQGKKIPTQNLPPSNLVFLIDVSGSMSDPNKLPLLKSSFKMLVQELREQDHVAIVVYAGAAGIVLEPTSGADKRTILDALDRLQAGGSTAGGEGIRLAYAVAKEHFKRDGNNRVILATDGDFNIGESSNAVMERLIEEKK